MKKKLLTLLFITSSVLGFSQWMEPVYPNFIGQDFKTIENNKDWSIITQVIGDIDNDGREDIALVLESVDSIYDQRKDYYDSLNNARILLVFLNQKGTQKVIIQNNKIIPRANEGGMLPYFVPELAIKDGVFSVINMYTRSSTYYEFKLIGCRMEIINISEYEVSGGTGDWDSYEYDYTTGIVTIKTGNINDEEEEVTTNPFDATPKSLSEFD